MKAVVTTIIFLICATMYGQEISDSLLSRDMDQVVITAQFTPTDTRETVNSVKVLSRKVIEQKAADRKSVV